MLIKTSKRWLSIAYTGYRVVPYSGRKLGKLSANSCPSLIEVISDTFILLALFSLLYKCPSFLLRPEKCLERVTGACCKTV